jgi:hypothetical protein
VYRVHLRIVEEARNIVLFCVILGDWGKVLCDLERHCCIMFQNLDWGMSSSLGGS